MNDTKYYPAAAFSFLLLLLLAGSLIVQTAGYVLGLSLSAYSLYIAFLPSLLVTYGYCFPLTRKLIGTALLMSLGLALLGIASCHMLDFTADGMGYQQASVTAVMNGWNPFGPNAIMLWQQLYPSGLWAIEASLSWLYGSVEAAKMMHVWLLFIAVPLLLFSMARYRGALNGQQVLLVILTVFSTTLLAQLLTHYVDADAYVAGLIFIAGALLYGHSRRFNFISAIVMAASLCIVINAKLSGIYHGVMLCAGAVLFLCVRGRRVPWKPIIVLAMSGAFAVLALGYRPYVTSFVQYGPSLFPPERTAYGPQLPPTPHAFLGSGNTEAFSAAQRPSSFDDLSPPERFIYSVFSKDGGAPHVPAKLKWPWTIAPGEWKFSGDPDPRSGGFGPLFALGLISSFGLFCYAIMRRFNVDKAFVTLAVVCLFFSAIFPQGWWARYVPFAYLVPFLLLLSVGSYDRFMRIGIAVVIVIFAINSEMALSAASVQYYKNERHFAHVISKLKTEPEGSVYLVPPVFNYKRYNGAYVPLQRRLREEGITSSVKPGAGCPHMVEMYSEFAICY